MMPQGCAAAAPEGQDLMQAADNSARLSRQISRRDPSHKGGEEREEKLTLVRII